MLRTLFLCTLVLCACCNGVVHTRSKVIPLVKLLQGSGPGKLSQRAAIKEGECTDRVHRPESNQKIQNNTKPDTEEQGTDNRQVLHTRQNHTSRKGVSAPGNTCRPTARQATVQKSCTHDPAQEPRLVPVDMHM
jgi:hypothetical protein